MMEAASSSSSSNKMEATTADDKNSGASLAAGVVIEENVVTAQVVNNEDDDASSSSTAKAVQHKKLMMEDDSSTMDATTTVTTTDSTTVESGSSTATTTTQEVEQEAEEEEGSGLIAAVMASLSEDSKAENDDNAAAEEPKDEVYAETAAADSPETKAMKEDAVNDDDDDDLTMQDNDKNKQEAESTGDDSDDAEKETSSKPTPSSSPKNSHESSSCSPTQTKTNELPPLNIFQKRAANVLRNFQTGLQIQQQQSQKAKQLRESMVKKHAVEKKKDEKKSPTEENASETTLTKTLLAESATDDSTMTTQGVTSTPLSQDGSELAESAKSSLQENDDSDKKKTTKPSPTGVLDLPALFKTSSSRPVTPINLVGESSQHDDEEDKDDDAPNKQDNLDVPTLQTQKSQDSTEMSPGGTLRTSFWSSLKSTISPKNEVNGDGIVTTTAPSTTPVDDSDSDDQDVAHQFAPFTYQTPTKCDICDGLLVGLWSQGLQCKLCKLNVHRGEGSNGHTNCRAEALLQDGGCRRHLRQCQVIAVAAAETIATAEGSDSNNTNPNNTNTTAPNNPNLTDAIAQVRQLAKEQGPNFFRDVKAQMDRDLQSRVKSMIVSKGAQEQKSKSLLRLRTNVVVPTVAMLDAIEKHQQYGGWKLAYGILLVAHVTTAVFVCTCCWMGLSVALWTSSSSNDAANPQPQSAPTRSHVAAILYSFHIAMFAMVLLIRRIVFTMHRKSKVLDQFLQEVFSLSAEEDLGISVHQFATRARLWMKRSTNTALGMLLLSLLVYRWMMAMTTTAAHGGDVVEGENTVHECFVDPAIEANKNQ